jgi:hypothetical protein
MVITLQAREIMTKVQMRDQTKMKNARYRRKHPPSKRRAM